MNFQRVVWLACRVKCAKTKKQRVCPIKHAHGKWMKNSLFPWNKLKLIYRALSISSFYLDVVLKLSIPNPVLRIVSSSTTTLRTISQRLHIVTRNIGWGSNCLMSMHEHHPEMFVFHPKLRRFFVSCFVRTSFVFQGTIGCTPNARVPMVIIYFDL